MRTKLPLIIFAVSLLTNQLLFSQYSGPGQLKWNVNPESNITPIVDFPGTGFCEDFTSTTFPPPSMSEEFTGTNYWARFDQSAYGTGAGSARFNCWSAPAGTIQSLISNTFATVASSTYLTFDEAYGPSSVANVDSLILESSTNDGISFTALARLWGGLGSQVGPLNTVFIGGEEFTPANNQWRSKIYLLPVGTNKVKLRARSGFGNDIWIDNVCVQSLAVPVAHSIGLASQGMWIPTDPYWRLEDTIRVYLHRTDFPNVVVDSAKGIMGVNALALNLMFNNAVDGTYYRVVLHRNSIETWSYTGTSYTRGTTDSHFNFIQPDGQAFANNQAIVSTSPLYHGMYSGDVNQDGFIDLTDIRLIYNAAHTLTTGYVVTDLTGDNSVDSSDVQIAYNNSSNLVTKLVPAGGESGNMITNSENALLNKKRKMTYILK